MQRHSATRRVGGTCAVLLALSFTACDVETDAATQHPGPGIVIVTGVDDSSSGDGNDDEGGTSSSGDDGTSSSGDIEGESSTGDTSSFIDEQSDLQSDLGARMVEVGDVVPHSLLPDRSVYVFKAGEEVATIVQLGITMDDVLSQDFQDSLPVIAEQYRILWGLPPWPGSEVICAYVYWI